MSFSGVFNTAMTCTLLHRPNYFFYLFSFYVRFVQKKNYESNNIIFKMIISYNFINESVLEYLKEIDHFFRSCNCSFVENI